MLGMRHSPAPRWGRSTFASLSVVALLALACFPLSAQADSSGIQYEDTPPTATTPGSEIPSRSVPPAKASGADGGAQAPADSTSSGSSGAGSSGDDESSGGGAAARGGDGGTGQGSPEKGGDKTDASGAQAIDAAASADDDGGGSSPLVPVLIAIAVLAAISVGAYVIRQRRQRRGPNASVSPEAG